MNPIKKINQIEPWIGEEEKMAMAEYLNSGGWLTEFKKTKEFEKRIADFTGVKYVAAVNNGTVSLVVALLALGIGKGDEVVVPDYTMIASANAIVLTGAKPLFVDINPETFCLDFEKTKKAISAKTKAIMLVTINGRYPKMEEFVELCKENNLFLIEDAAQSFGSKYKGKHLGTFGDIGSFSFSPHKIITTGQGGAVVTDNENFYQKILKIKDFGRPKSGVDYHEVMGYNFKFTDLQAVIGIEQIKKIDLRIRRKKEIFKLYQELLREIKEIEFIETDLEDTAPWFVDILVAKEDRNKLAEFLAERGIGTRPFYPAIHTQPPYSYVKGDFKNSEAISERGLWLPSSSFLKDEEIEYICNTIKEFYSK
ncbi:MAG: DegT/DnrJ/EryC1/StrS family aminotransferase [Nanoarchaeota archaeon]|nr:DegT/DnrJ/EryC1/StrS family aminotransferase [Nanoarchaeota archaeon]